MVLLNCFKNYSKPFISTSSPFTDPSIQPQVKILQKKCFIVADMYSDVVGPTVGIPNPHIVQWSTVQENLTLKKNTNLLECTKYTWNTF